MRRAKKLLDRPIGEIMVLLMAGTICLAIILGGAGIILVIIIHPHHDVTGAEKILGDTLATAIGLVAGYLAGRTDKRKEDDSDESSQ